ncbi:PLP-dependent aminotransferase family protein [Azospirillaceae bacterium]
MSLQIVSVNTYIVTMTSWTPDLSSRLGPRYRAIADALADDVAHGRLPIGSQLPTHRELAHRLKVTVGTITRAYAEAERRGLIGGEIGRGTFVRGHQDSLPTALADSTALAEPLTPTSGNSSPIDFTICQPHATEVDRALAEAVATLGLSGRLADVLGYAPHLGLPRHRAAGAQWLIRRHRVTASADTTVITIGAQNGTTLALAAIARPGDVVLCEQLTYYGVKAIAALLGHKLEGVAIDEHGLIPQAFDAACRRVNPRALYLIPTIHNPTASVMPQERRTEIVAIARRHGVYLIEDDVFGYLAPDAPPPIQRIAPDITVFLSSLSKCIASGLRVGYAIAPPAVISRYEAAIRAFHYSSPALMAEIAAHWITSGQADSFADAHRQEALARQKLARDILPNHLLQGHNAGQHLWMNLPEPWRREDFTAEALRRGVAVTGADIFAVGRAGVPHAVRLSLCMPATRAEVQKGAQILTEVINDSIHTSYSVV